MVTIRVYSGVATHFHKQVSWSKKNHKNLTAYKFFCFQPCSLNKRTTQPKNKKKPTSFLIGFNSAEKEGFEPPDLLQSTVFKTAAFDRSAISPINHIQYLIAGANISCFFYSQSFLIKKNSLF